MPNELDEVTGPVNEKGRDVHVIEKQIPVTVGTGTKVFEVIMWCLAILPGLILLLCKVNAGKKLSQQQQKIQHDASQIDNYMEQRVIILQNVAKLLDKAIDLDKSTFTKIAEARSGGIQQYADTVEKVQKKINIAVENYPDLKAHNEIEDAMQQNSYLQREITAAREKYNDSVREWNTMIYQWPAYQMVAAKRGYTTRIPFSIDSETRAKARSVAF